MIQDTYLSTPLFSGSFGDLIYGLFGVSRCHIVFVWIGASFDEGSHPGAEVASRLWFHRWLQEEEKRSVDGGETEDGEASKECRGGEHTLVNDLASRILQTNSLVNDLASKHNSTLSQVSTSFVDISEEVLDTSSKG
jgi:hypothetical protein